MKKQKTSLNVLCAAAALFLSAPQAMFAGSSGGTYQLESSVVDSGGGEKMTGGTYMARGSVAQGQMPDNTGIVNGGGYSNRVGFYNPPHFIYQKGLPVVLDLNSSTQLTFPPGSVDKNVFDITINNDPVGQPLYVDSSKVSEATRKIVNNEGGWSQPVSNNLAEVAIFDEQDAYAKPLANTGTLVMHYTDANNDGIVDGSNPAVRVQTLAAWRLDETRNTWVELPGTGADTAARTITVPFNTTGVYSMIGTQDTGISKSFKAYPVPFRPNGPDAGTGLGQTGTEAAGITFENAPQSGKIEIYTLDGRLVKKISVPDSLPFPYKVNWDVRTASGQKAASGVYIWRVNAAGSSMTGKLMVIW